MGSDEITLVLQRLIGMVSSVELATTAIVEILIESRVIERDTILRELAAKRDALDPTYSKGSFDMLIERLTPKSADGLH
jgi:hypothetical protein